jgi:hypothetical protein
VAQPNTPEVVGRIRWKKDRNHLQLTGLVNQLRFAFDDGSGSARALKYGANFTGLFVFGGGDREMVSFGVAGGEGIASWAASTGSEPLDAILTADGDLTTLPFLEYNVGFRHNWTKDWNSAILWAHSKAWLDDLQGPDTYSDGGVFHLNLLWTSAKRFLTGIEYIWGYRETKDGRRGIADRVQVSLKWQFNP